TDTDETLTVSITGRSEERRVGKDTHTVTSTGAAIDVSSWTLSGLSVTADSAHDGTFTLTVTSTANDGGSLASTTGTITVTVNEQAEAPSLSVGTGTASGSEDVAIPLTVSTFLVDTSLTVPDNDADPAELGSRHDITDTDETLTVSITG